MFGHAVATTCRARGYPTRIGEIQSSPSLISGVLSATPVMTIKRYVSIRLQKLERRARRIRARRAVRPTIYATAYARDLSPLVARTR